jgi:hypothetical protein
VPNTLGPRRYAACRQGVPEHSSPLLLNDDRRGRAQGRFQLVTSARWRCLLDCHSIVTQSFELRSRLRQRFEVRSLRPVNAHTDPPTTTGPAGKGRAGRIVGRIAIRRRPADRCRPSGWRTERRPRTPPARTSVDPACHRDPRSGHAFFPP